ncbi:TPA: type VI secretion system tube protein Hcp [Proteus mirabilis]
MRYNIYYVEIKIYSRTKSQEYYTIQNRKLNGNKQGLSTDYDISRHQNISHAPFVFEKADDKSSALLLSSITNNEILECDFKYYRIDKNGGLLHYKTIKLTKSSIIRIKNTHPNSLLKNEYYLSYQLWDGDDIVIIEFVIPREQAEHITKLIYELGGANALFCATRITHVLKLSGGVFSNLDTPIYIRSPWELKKQLLDIYFPERGGIISGAY